MSRRQLREEIFKLLFRVEFNSKEDMATQCELFFEDDDVTYDEGDEKYIQDKYNRISEKLEEIDKMIDEKSEGWTTDRMGKVDLTIIRLGIYEILYDEEGNELERHHLDPEVGNFGYVVPKGSWHSIEVYEPSVIFEAKDGKYGEDGSETLEEYKSKIKTNMITEELKKRVADFVEMEQRSCSMQVMSPEYVARCMQISMEDAAEALEALKNN